MTDLVSSATGDDERRSVQGSPAVPKRRHLGPGDVLLFALTRVAFVSVSLDETRAEKYPATTVVPDYGVDKDQAEFLFKTEREDSAHTDDKVKQLLTLSSSLAAVILVFARDVRPRWIVVLVLALLVASVFLCIGVFGVRTVNVPTVEDAKRSENDGVWAKDVLRAYADNEARHAFRVDRHRAASRYFRLALLLTPIAAAFTASRPEAGSNVVTALNRIDSSVNHLRVTLESSSTQRPAAPAPIADSVAGSPGTTKTLTPPRPDTAKPHKHTRGATSNRP